MWFWGRSTSFQSPMVASLGNGMTKSSLKNQDSQISQRSLTRQLIIHLMNFWAPGGRVWFWGRSTSFKCPWWPAWSTC